MNRILIIQGPILSIGRTGASWFKEKITKDDIVNFNTIDDINLNIQLAEKIFDLILLCTWASENLNKSSLYMSDKLSVLELEDPTPELLNKNKEAILKINNKYRMSYGIKKACDYLLYNYSKNDLVIKIRTDQIIDLKECLNQTEFSIAEDKNKLLIPFYNKDNFNVSDFYHGGTLSTISDYFSAMINFNFLEFHPNVHIELSLKYAYQYLFNKINVDKIYYFSRSLENHNLTETLQIIEYLKANFYQPFSESIFTTLNWRGKEMIFPDNYLESCIFRDSHNQMKTSGIKKNGILLFRMIFLDKYYLFIGKPNLSKFFKTVEKLYLKYVKK